MLTNIIIIGQRRLVHWTYVHLPAYCSSFSSCESPTRSLDKTLTSQEYRLPRIENGSYAGKPNCLNLTRQIFTVSWQGCLLDSDELNQTEDPSSKVQSPVVQPSPLPSSPSFSPINKRITSQEYRLLRREEGVD